MSLQFSTANWFARSGAIITYFIRKIWKQYLPIAHVGPLHPAGHWHLKPDEISWQTPPLAQGFDTQACSANEKRASYSVGSRAPA